MSDLQFYKSEMEGFLKTHPREEEWKVYKCREAAVQTLSLNILLDFLRDECPAILTHRLTINEVRERALLGLPPEACDPAVESNGDLHQEFDAKRWSGTVELEWNGHPLHFYRVCSFGYYSDTLFIAAKSNSALRDFLRALRAYGRMRRKKSRLMIGINGRDLLIPPVAWEEVILHPGQAEEVRGNVDAFFQGRERYRQLGLPYRRGLLFVGPPGCGKTLTIKAIAHSSCATFITVFGKADIDDDHLERAFELSVEHSPSVLLFEDIEKMMKAGRCSLSYFLNLLDGLSVADGVLVIATANDPGKLDPALLHRPSRFDRVWRFPLPGEAQRLALLCKRGGAFFSEAALGEAAKRSSGFSMAYVQEIVVNALLDAAHRGEAVTDQHLSRSLEALKAQRHSVTKEQDSMEDLNSIGFARSGMINV